MVQYAYVIEEYFVSFFGDLFKKPKLDAIYEVKSPNNRLVATFVVDHGQISYFVKKTIKSFCVNRVSAFC